MKDKTKKMLLVSGIAAAGMAAVGTAVTYVGTNYLMKLAMDRDAPKTKNRKRAKEHLSGEPGHDSALEKPEVCERTLKKVECEVVEISGSDGEKLVGHWYPEENAKRIIIAMHGWRSSWTKDFGVVSDFWNEEGCSVLYADQRGQNNSGGDYIGFGLTERFDCLEWVKWADAHNEAELPIYLAGVSMGATTVLMASGSKLPDSVHGIMADCGFTSPHEIWKHIVENNLHLSYRKIGKFASSICKKKIHAGAEDYSTIDALKINQIPVLFIHGTDDRFVPVEMTYENYKACTAPKRLFVVPGAGHGMSYAIDKTGYQSAMRDFWNSYDRWANGHADNAAGGVVNE